MKLSSTINNYIKVFMLCLMLASVVSCATQNKSLLLGSIIGASIGGIIGHQIPNQYNDQNIAVGSVLGGMLGAAIGNAQYKNKTEKMNQPPPELANKLDETPSLTMPKVRRIWVPDRIENDKYISGHYIFVIEKSSSWINSGDKDGK